MKKITFFETKIPFNGILSFVNSFDSDETFPESIISIKSAFLNDDMVSIFDSQKFDYCESYGYLTLLQEKNNKPISSSLLNELIDIYKDWHGESNSRVFSDKYKVLDNFIGSIDLFVVDRKDIGNLTEDSYDSFELVEMPEGDDDLLYSDLVDGMYEPVIIYKINVVSGLVKKNIYIPFSEQEPIEVDDNYLILDENFLDESNEIFFIGLCDDNESFFNGIDKLPILETSKTLSFVYEEDTIENFKSNGRVAICNSTLYNRYLNFLENFHDYSEPTMNDIITVISDVKVKDNYNRYVIGRGDVEKETFFFIYKPFLL